jgi:hypothetical protein
MTPGGKGSRLGLALRAGAYAFLALVGLWLFPSLILPLGEYFVAGALGVFAAAAVANAVTLRIYERGQLSDIGLGWNRDSAWNLALGLAGGAGGALLVLLPPLAAGLAEIRPDPELAGGWASILFVGVVLAFGAIGEEMLFRGYGFQILLAGAGPFATILPVSVLFGILHSNNPSATILSTANTVGWGIILGVAFLRSGDLWLPIGLHLGWNLVLPALGARLSGFTMNVAGYAMRWNAGDLWSGGAYGPEGGVLTSVVLAALGLFLWKAPVRGQVAFLLHARKEG